MPPRIKSLKPGDKIQVYYKQRNMTVEGEVLTATNWHDYRGSRDDQGNYPDDWYIEFKSPMWGYIYVKQKEDQAEITKLE